MKIQFNQEVMSELIKLLIFSMRQFIFQKFHFVSAVKLMNVKGGFDLLLKIQPERNWKYRKAITDCCEL